jgi:hypothetical protein
MFTANSRPYKLPNDATWFITGCSSGIGKALAQHIANKPPHNLIATARNLDDLAYLSDDNTHILKLQLDVTSSDQVKQAFGKTIERFRTISVLVNVRSRRLRFPRSLVLPCVETRRRRMDRISCQGGEPGMGHQLCHRRACGCQDKL